MLSHSKGSMEHHVGPGGTSYLRGRPTSSLPVRSPCTPAHWSLKALWPTSYHILLGQTPLLLPLTLPERTSPVEEQPTSAAPPTPYPKQSPRPKRWLPSPDPVESMPLGGITPKVTLGRPPSSKIQEVPSWYRALKLSCAEAFNLDSDLVRQARREFFLKHSSNFTTDGTHNLS